jgi:hypothetical protein
MLKEELSSHSSTEISLPKFQFKSEMSETLAKEDNYHSCGKMTFSVQERTEN